MISLYAVLYHGFDSQTGVPETWDSNSDPMFRQMREALKGQARVVAVSFMSHIDLTYGSTADTEKAYRQEVSGKMFSEFGLRPALGRLLTEDDDRVPGAKPFAVLSYDYWTARFGGMRALGLRFTTTIQTRRGRPRLACGSKALARGWCSRKISDSATGRWRFPRCRPVAHGSLYSSRAI